MKKYYKGLNENWKDIRTNTTLYKAGKIIKIPKKRRNKELCSDGVLHASKDIFDIFKSVRPKTFCIVEGKPVIEKDDKSGFHEYKVVKRLKQREINKLLKMNYDLTPITDYFKRTKKPTAKDIKLLNEWIKVVDSVSGSVYGSVYGSVRDSMCGSVWGSMYDSVWYSVWGSMCGSMRDSMWDSIYGFIGHLFTHVKKWKYIKTEKKEYPYQPVVELIKRGFMPCTDGTYWYLLSGKKFKIVYKKDLRKNE